MEPDDYRIGYLPQLDGLRGVAVLAVMVHHTAAFLLPDTVSWLAVGGFLGVDLFFVLSGWLITRLIIERHGDGETTPGLFYLRRVRRLAPALVVFVAATVAWTAVSVPARLEVAAWEAAAALTYVANYLEVGGVLGHVWSLAIEEQFYLVWPLVLLTSLNRGVGRRKVAAGLVVVIVATAVWRSTLWAGPELWYVTYKRTDTRADALAIGCLVAVVWPYLAAARWRAVPYAATLLASAVLFVPRDSAVLHTVGFTLVAGLCAILVGAAASSQLSWVDVGWLRTVGRLSYSLYLWHFLVFRAVGQADTGVSGVVVGWMLSFGAAWSSWRFVERPLRLRGLGPVLVGHAGLRGAPVAEEKGVWSDRFMASPVGSWCLERYPGGRCRLHRGTGSLADVDAGRVP